MFAVEVELTWVEELAAQVDAGEIGLAEATLFGLRVVAGAEEEPEAPVAIDPHDADELIVGWAYGVEAGDDPDADPETLAEITAIMDAILITEDDLLIASGEMEPPAGTDAGDGDVQDSAVEDADNGGESDGDEQSLPVGGVGVELAGVQTVEAPVRVGCAKLFPGRVAGRTCIKSDSFDLADGIRLRVWQPEDAPVDLNVGAHVRDGSEEVLGFLRGNLELPRAIDVLLIHELSTQKGRADGVATFGRTPQRCLVSLDRVSYDAGRVGLLGHELAHCAQAVEFGGHGGMETDWWAEGTAEWVAEQVQPGYATGTDWVRFESFVQSLTTRTYDNWAFFQHWQNTHGGGPETVFALMKTIAATDSSPDAAVNIDGFFDAYASYVDAWHEGGIASPSGPIPLPEFPEPTITIGARGETRTGNLPPLAVRAVGVEVAQASDEDPAELTLEGDPDAEAVFKSDWSTIDDASGSWTFCDPADPHAQDTIVAIGAGEATSANVAIANGNPATCGGEEVDIALVWSGLANCQMGIMSGEVGAYLGVPDGETGPTESEKYPYSEPCQRQAEVLEDTYGTDNDGVGSTEGCEAWMALAAEYSTPLDLRLSVSSNADPVPTWHTGYFGMPPAEVAWDMERNRCVVTGAVPELTTGRIAFCLPPPDFDPSGRGDLTNYRNVWYPPVRCDLPAENEGVVPPFMTDGPLSAWRCVEVYPDAPEPDPQPEPAPGPPGGPGAPPAPAPPPPPLDPSSLGDATVECSKR